MIPTPSMKKLRAFYGDAAVKEKYVARVKEHAAQDVIVKGQYWDGGKGCAVGCTLEDGNDNSGIHAKYETELGIPEAIAHLEDYLFEAMPNEDAMRFPLCFLEAIPVGADLSLVPVHLIIYILDDLQNVKEVKEDEAVSKSIKGVLALWKEVLAGHEVPAAAWSAAESAAWSAAESAARSAAESAAESAAWSAAWSAAAKRYSEVLLTLLGDAPVH